MQLAAGSIALGANAASGGSALHQHSLAPASMPQVNPAPQRLHTESGVAATGGAAAGAVVNCAAANGAEFSGASFAINLPTYFLLGLTGAAFFASTSLWSRELPYEPLKRLPFAVRLSPLPMMLLLM